MKKAHSILLPLAAAIAIVFSSASAWAQAQPARQKPGTITTPAQVKPQAQQKSPAAAPVQKPPPAAANPATKSAESVAPPKNSPHATQPTLIGQYDGWGAYLASPGGRKICFAAARPSGAQTNRSRSPTYLFITSRPQDKVKDEISAIASFPFKASSDAVAAVGNKQFALATQADGAWVKNVADETKLIEAMRKGGDLILKGTTDRGLQSTDTFSMKGLAQALDRIARECK